MFPEAVDDDACGEGIFGGDEPFREGETVGGGVFRERAEEGGDAGAVDAFVFFEPVAADEEVGGAFEGDGEVLGAGELGGGVGGEGAVDFRDAGEGFGYGGIGGECGPAGIVGEEDAAAFGDEGDGAAGVAALVEGEAEGVARKREGLGEDEDAGAGAVDLGVGPPAGAVGAEAVVGVEEGFGFVADDAGDLDFRFGAVGCGGVEVDLAEHGAPLGGFEGGFRIDGEEFDAEGADDGEVGGGGDFQVEDGVVGDVGGGAELGIPIAG